MLKSQIGSVDLRLATLKWQCNGVQMFDPDNLETATKPWWLGNKYVRWSLMGIGGTILLILFKLPLLIMLGIGFAMGWMYRKLTREKEVS
jgi:hypothetical protein